MIRSHSSRSGSLFAFALAAVLATILGIGIARPDVRPTGLMRDFEAFYCAGRAVTLHADPYRAEPIGRCERESKPSAFLAGKPGLSMPAPLPPYAMLPFVALARLPFVFAAIVWSCCILLSVAVAVFAVRRATGAPLVPLVCAFALTDGYASLCLGQVAPLAVAGIALAGMLLGERRDRSAALAAAVAMLEPHVGLPACLALFVWRSRSRAILALAAVAAALASLALVGWTTTLEYVREVVPAHALSEIVNEKQFSLTYALHRLGAGDALALRAGEWSYVATLLIGMLVARAIAKRTGDGAVFAVLPPAIVLVGGPFVHIAQMSAALPAAFVLYRHAAGGSRRTLGCAIVLLAIPWIQFADLGTIFGLMVPPVAALLVATLVDGRPLVALGSGAIAFLFVELLYPLLANAPSATALLLAQYDPRALAEASWTLYVRAVGTANARAFDFAKIPTIVGLVTLASAAALVALRPSQSAGPREARLPKWRGAETLRRIATR